VPTYKSIDGASWDHLLILQTSFLGDMVLTLPLIDEVRRRFPVRRLTLLCQPMARELLQDHPAIDEIIVDDKKGADGGIGGLHRKAQALAARRFTMALTPHKSWRSALLLALAGIPCRIGFAESRGWFLFHRRARRDPARHDVERNLSLLEVFGVAPTDCQRALELPIDPAVEKRVERKFAALGLDSNRPIIGVNPGSIWPTKRWSAARFGQLIRMLKEKIDCQVVLFGGAEDASVVNEVLASFGGQATSLVRQIDLRELAAAIRRCQVYVTNDSGPMHIAVATRVPTVAIFCATTRDLGFFPYTQAAIVVEKNISCRPCTTHGGRRCPLGSHACSEQIDAALVVHAVEKLLRSGPRGAPSANSFVPEFLAA
jgi:heptosyltransferase-2